MTCRVCYPSDVLCFVLSYNQALNNFYSALSFSSSRADRIIGNNYKCCQIKVLSTPRKKVLQFFCQKADDTLQLCIYYRKLNHVTVKNKYSLPRINHLFNQLSGSHRFPMIDLRSSYQQYKFGKKMF